MRNNNQPRTKTILALTESLPFFNSNNLAPVEKNKTYLKVIFSRYAKSGKLFRLKKGFYVTKSYVDESQKNGSFSSYLEFLANVLYRPSYLSLDYILYQHNLITELPVNYTLVTSNKTACFMNKLGRFFYRTIKKDLFCGFKITTEGNFTILKATKAKALFDFLYLRKNLLIDKRAVEELRLNLNTLTVKDINELKKYVNLEGSRKMESIFKSLIQLWKQ